MTLKLKKDNSHSNIFKDLLINDDIKVKDNYQIKKIVIPI